MTSHSPKLNMHKQNNKFPAIDFSFFFAILLIFLLKIVDFENNLYSLHCNRDFIRFSNVTGSYF